MDPSTGSVLMIWAGNGWHGPGSLADFNFALTYCTEGKSIDDTEQERTAVRRARDEGYARVTVKNAAAACREEIRAVVGR